jgi:hypothetical protein
MEERVPVKEKMQVIDLAKKYSVERLATGRWTEINPSYVHPLLIIILLM